MTWQVQRRQGVGAGYGFAEDGELEEAGAVFVAENARQLSEYLLAALETGNNDCRADIIPAHTMPA